MEQPTLTLRSQVATLGLKDGGKCNYLTETELIYGLVVQLFDVYCTI